MNDWLEQNFVCHFKIVYYWSCWGQHRGIGGKSRLRTRSNSLSKPSVPAGRWASPRVLTTLVAMVRLSPKYRSITAEYAQPIRACALERRQYSRALQLYQVVPCLRLWWSYQWNTPLFMAHIWMLARWATAFRSTLFRMLRFMAFLEMCCLRKCRWRRGLPLPPVRLSS